MNSLDKILAGSLFTFALASVAGASIIPVYQTAVPDGNDYRWTYTVSASNSVRVQSGDYFTIYDFGGLDGNPQMPAGWAYSTADTGPVPFLLAPTDDPTIANITFTYTGTTPIAGPADIGDFSVDSNGNIPITTQWASYSTRNGGPQDGQFATDLGYTDVPEQITQPNNPEPAVSGIFLGVAAMLGLRRRK